MSLENPIEKNTYQLLSERIYDLLESTSSDLMDEAYSPVRNPAYGTGQFLEENSVSNAKAIEEARKYLEKTKQDLKKEIDEANISVEEKEKLNKQIDSFIHI